MTGEMGWLPLQYRHNVSVKVFTKLDDEMCNSILTKYHYFTNSGISVS